MKMPMKDKSQNKMFRGSQYHIDGLIKLSNKTFLATLPLCYQREKNGMNILNCISLNVKDIWHTEKWSFKVMCTLIPGTCEYTMLSEKGGFKVADGIKVVS
jgi:hypothetical protein